MNKLIKPIVLEDYKGRKFTYCYENNIARIKFSRDDFQIPKFLYKYYSLNSNNYDCLKDKNVFLSHPYLLNDIFDSRLDSLLNFESFIINKFKSCNINISESELKQQIKDFKEENEKYYNYRGTLSLSETYENDLMWAHYTGEKGYCIEFNTEEIIKLDNVEQDNTLLFPINYQNQIKEIDVKQHLLYEGNDYYKLDIALLYAYSVKNSLWSYEKEWRILTKRNYFTRVIHPLSFENYFDKLKKRTIGINDNSINKIILGIEFFNNKRFEKIDDNKYYFLKTNKNDSEEIKTEKKLIKKFMFLLEKRFNDKIFLLGLKNFKRVIMYSITIEEKNNEIVKITKKEI